MFPPRLRIGHSRAITAHQSNEKKKPIENFDMNRPAASGHGRSIQVYVLTSPRSGGLIERPDNVPKMPARFAKFEKHGLAICVPLFEVTDIQKRFGATDLNNQGGIVGSDRPHLRRADPIKGGLLNASGRAQRTKGQGISLECYLRSWSPHRCEGWVSRGDQQFARKAFFSRAFL